MGIYLGIDTSNYKTSVAAVSDSGDIIFSRSEYLEVAQGERGLRQSEVFFRQSNKLPDFISDMFSGIKTQDIEAIGVSSRPRRIEGSYMPCFLAGINAAKEIGSVLSIPVLEFSHQEGHAAAIIEHGNNKPERCILFHLSGGTTEFLLCEPDEDGYHTEIIGGTRDISIGQLLDRTGVAMGYGFPSGVYLDEIAGTCRSSSSLKLRINYSDGYFNLSGIETKILRYLETENDNDKRSEVISDLFISISDLLETSAVQLAEKYNVNTVYMAGGVASSNTVRNKLSNIEIIKFGLSELSGDNAVGIAFLARRIKNS